MSDSDNLKDPLASAEEEMERPEESVRSDAAEDIPAADEIIGAMAEQTAAVSDTDGAADGATSAESVSDDVAAKNAEMKENIAKKYSDFESAWETADTLLLVFGQRVTLLQKQDLVRGDFSGLSRLLAEKIAVYQRMD